MNGETNLEMLQQVVWPAVKKKYAFQQDYASVHITLAVKAFLEQKFGGSTKISNEFEQVLVFIC